MFEWFKNLFKPTPPPIFVTASSIVQKGVKSRGVIITIGVDIFADEACTIPVYSLEWGDMEVGATYTKQLYLKNKGSTPIKTTLMVGNWNPTATSQYLAITWDKQNATVGANSVVPFTVTILVSTTTTGITTWGCNLIFQGITL